jgi:hypothetical protein
MWNRLLICGMAFGLATESLAEADNAADALQPANRSEVALLMERLAALEQRTAEREAKLQSRIEGLEKRLRQLEYQQPIHRMAADPRPNRNPSPPISRWNVQWLETGVRWLPNGDFAWSPTKMGLLDPQPFEARGTHTWGCFKRYCDLFTQHIDGPDVIQFWITPPGGMDNPLEGGFLIGTAQNHSQSNLSAFDVLSDLLESFQPKGIWEPSWMLAR